MRGSREFGTLWVEQSCSRAAPSLQPAVGVTPGMASISHICVGRGDTLDGRTPAGLEREDWGWEETNGVPQTGKEHGETRVPFL